MNGHIIAASAGITQLRRMIDLIDSGLAPAEMKAWCEEQIKVREEIIAAETTGIPRQRKIRPRQARSVACPTGKVPWRSVHDAERALEDTQSKRSGDRPPESRHYRCPHCHYWHLTSSPLRTETNTCLQ